MEVIAIIFAVCSALVIVTTSWIMEVRDRQRKALKRKLEDDRIMKELDQPLPLKPRLKEDPSRNSEKDPFLREISAAGYSHVKCFSGPEHTMELLKDGKVCKKIIKPGGSYGYYSKR